MRQGEGESRGVKVLALVFAFSFVLALALASTLVLELVLRVVGVDDMRVDRFADRRHIVRMEAGSASLNNMLVAGASIKLGRTVWTPTKMQKPRSTSR